MKKMFLFSFLFFLTICHSVWADEIEMTHKLNCNFFLQTIKLMSVQTFSAEREVVDTHSEVVFSGIEKSLANINENLSGDQLFHFTLDEGQAENIYITVSVQKNEEGNYIAQAVNPALPVGDKMDGHCSLKTR